MASKGQKFNNYSDKANIKDIILEEYKLKRNIRELAERYNIPEGTKAINAYGFNFSNLEKIVFPESVTTIGDYALGQMINLKEFTIPSTVTNLGIGVFEVCSNLKSVVLPDNLSEIPDDMFVQCWTLKNIDLPNNLTSIGSYAFFNCDKLIEIAIPASVTSIGEYAFANSGLRIVTSHMDIPCTITSTVFNNITKVSQVMAHLHNLT